MIVVEPNDLWVMLLSTIRYSMGRMSYMTFLAPELVLRYAGGLSQRQLQQIADEIEQELLTCERDGRTLGMTCDHRGWQEAAVAIREKADG